ncbi:MAG: hypothetical protein M1561_04545 [Gammaproteobacteria bacterium]|nr:hypothetical protein [Gammaproteobacteria bacterium]
MEKSNIKTKSIVKKTNLKILFLIPVIAGFITYSIFVFISQDQDNLLFFSFFAALITFFIVVFIFILKNKSPDRKLSKDHFYNENQPNPPSDRHWRTSIGSLKNPLGLYRSGSPNDVYKNHH